MSRPWTTSSTRNQAFAAMTAARERADQLAASRQSPAAGTDVPRASWDDYFLQIASTVASRSTCVRRQVGAVVAADRHIVATGYNGPPSGMPHCDDGGCLRATAAGVARSVDYSSCVAVHAELNALLRSAPADRDGATLYCTDLPCWDCARAVANSGIVRVVAAGGMYDRWPTTAEFLEAAGVAVDGPAVTVDTVSGLR